MSIIITDDKADLIERLSQELDYTRGELQMAKLDLEVSTRIEAEATERVKVQEDILKYQENVILYQQRYMEELIRKTSPRPNTLFQR
jgi:hypothetical protein